MANRSKYLSACHLGMRKEVGNELEKIRLFRNRINHNEPICFKHAAIDFSYALDIHTSIENIITWIDPGLIGFISDMDKVNRKIDSAKRI